MLSYSNSARSIGSSLMTVSDLEEDLRAASLFLSSKRTSSVFTDSMEDLSSLADFGDVAIGAAACTCLEMENASSAKWVSFESFGLFFFY